MKSMSLKIVLGCLLFLLAGFLGYTLLPSGGETLSRISQADPTEVVEQGVEAVQSSPETTPPLDRTPISTEEGQPTLRYTSLKTDDENGTARACLQFDGQFEAASETDLKPYFRVSDDTPFSLDARANQICVLGLEYGQTYSVRVLKGLTADNGAELQRDRRVYVSFEDKPSFVGFAGEGIILPETKGARVVLKTVNVETLDLSLYRVNDRILSQHSPDAGESGTADDYVSTYDASNRRVLVWSGEVEIETDRNNVVETAFDLQDKIEGQGPGAYILIAKHDVEGQPDYRSAKAMRWLISTDLALTSYRGSDALHVAVRSIKEAQLKAGIRLDLVANNNEQLAEVITDSEGRAVFDNALLSGDGPLSPRMIMAYGPDGDYAVLDLSRAPLDLSAMDVQGRDVTGPLDLYAFTDRGIYRPGQTIQLTALLRDSNAVAIRGRTLNVDLKRPDGVLDSNYTLSDDKAGGYVLSLPLSQQAARGSWTIEIGVEGTETKIYESVSVEDFVPQRLKLTLKPEEQPVLTPGESRDIVMDAQFYYGAPGSNLETEAELRLQRDPNPFPTFKAYSFGDVTETFREDYIALEPPLTDDEGQSKLSVNISEGMADSSHPLRASVIAGVAEPGGRYVRENVFIPVRGLDSYVGFKSRFGERAERNKPAEIDLVSLNAAGERVAALITWTLNRERRDYSWYRYRNRWQYRNRTTDEFIDQGTLTIAADTPATWAQSLNWGRYRLDVETADGTKSSYRFGVGWSNWGESDSDAPDRILVGATDLPDTPGGSVTLNLKAPYAGRGDIVFADHTVRSIRTIDIPEGASSVRVPYDPSWGHDVYAMVTLYTPLDAEKRQSVKRAVGLTHIGLDRAPQTLGVEIGTPPRVAPRTKLEVPITLSGAAASQMAWVSVAAVDEGILALTNFTSPDAADAYFSKKAFSLDIRDDYSRILNPYLANGPTRSGGDSIGGAGLSVVPTKTVALFEGLVEVRNGKATVPFDLPDFNGELRIMATAWSETAVGSASTSIKVRDAVPAELSLPRFLAPGDQAVATLALDNIDGADGTYRTTVAAPGLFEAVSSVFDLSPGTRDQTALNIDADDIGVFNFTTEISGPKGYAVTSTNPIEVRSPYRPVTRRTIEALDPGETFQVSADLLDGYSVIGADVTVSVARLPGLSVAPYLNALNRYPYGCTEQTVSKAMPLLFVESLGGLRGTSDDVLRQRIQSAIETVSARQSASGEFGLWRQGDGYLAPWLQLYVSEFLIEADREGFDVAENVLASAVTAAQILSRMEDYSRLDLAFPNTETRKAAERQKAERAAYAHYIAAIGGKADASGIRYVDKAFGDKMKTPLSHAYLGAALARIGDEARADAAFVRAAEQLGKDQEYSYYASDTRDAAGVLAIGGRDLPDEVAEDILLRLADFDPAQTSTQEKSFIVRAIAAQDSADDDVSVKASGFELSGKSAAMTGVDLRGDLSLRNTGDARAFVTVDVTSTPTRRPDTISKGFKVEKTLYTLKGKPISTASLKRGERVVVLVDAQSQYSSETMMVMADLLPSGLEIETVLTPGDAEDEGSFAFLPELSEFDLQEARDDRFVASDRRMRWERNRRTFRAAYVARAVTVGDFVFPGAVVEDMYRPAYVGTSESSRLQISPAGDF